MGEPGAYRSATTRIRLGICSGLLLFGGNLVAYAQPSVDDPIIAIEEALLGEDYRRVIQLSETVTDLAGSEIPFYRGVAYRELGDARAAATALREYLGAGGTFEEEARALLLQIEEDMVAAPRRVRYLVQASVVYDSRVLVSDTAPPFLREEDDLAVRVSLAMDLDPVPRFRVRYRSHWLQYLEWSEASRWDQALSLGFRGSALGGDYELIGLGESWLRDYQPVFWRAGARGEQAWLVARDRIFWTGLEAGQDQYPESSVFDGVYALVSAGYEQYFRDGSLLWDLFGQWHDAEEDPLRFYEVGAGVASSYWLTARWSGGLSARLSRAAYSGYDSVLGVERTDTYFSSRAWLSVAMHRTVSMVPSVEFIASDSNTDIADYDRYVMSLSLVWNRW